MGSGTREGTKKSVGANRATSASVVHLLQIGNNDLFHLEHGVPHSFEILWFRELAVTLKMGNGTTSKDVVRNGVPQTRNLAGFHPAPQSHLLLQAATQK